MGKLNTAWDLPENTKEEIINKIDALARQIRMDWSDPSIECRKISELYEALRLLSELCEALKLLDKNK